MVLSLSLISHYPKKQRLHIGSFNFRLSVAHEHEDTMAEAGSESTAIELEMAKRKEHELMKKFAENAAKITLQQIERDSAGTCYFISIIAFFF